MKKWVDMTETEITAVEQALYDLRHRWDGFGDPLARLVVWEEVIRMVEGARKGSDTPKTPPEEPKAGPSGGLGEAKHP